MAERAKPYDIKWLGIVIVMGLYAMLIFVAAAYAAHIGLD
jgi:hypothetical protein